jgi:hypothetical protein
MLAIFALAALSATLPQGPDIAGNWPRLPRPEQFTDLRYPHEALEARLVGVVVLHIRTDTNGRVINAEVLTGPVLLARPSIENVRTWKWPAGVRDAAIVYRFEIDSGLCRDDRQSLFRLVHSNFVRVTACSAPGRTGLSYAIGYDNYRFGGIPAYPDLALSARMTGVVVLRLRSGAGDRLVAEPLTQIPYLTDAAVAHASQWRTDGKKPNPPVAVYEFALDNQSCGPSGGTAFFPVEAGYVKLSACGPVVQPGDFE